MLTGDSANEYIGGILTIIDDIKKDTMKMPKGSLVEAHRAQINGITKAYIELSRKILDRLMADQLADTLYFDFEKPISEYLGFAMSSKIPYEYIKP